MSGSNADNGNNGSNGKKPVGVLEVMLLLKKHPQLVVEPCCSTGCRLRIPECRAQDGLGHMMGNSSLAVCYLKQRAVEVSTNGYGKP